MTRHQVQAQLIRIEATSSPSCTTSCILASHSVRPPVPDQEEGGPGEGVGKSHLAQHLSRRLPRARCAANKGAMPAPGIAVERGQVLHHPGAEGIEVDVADEFEEKQINR